MTAGALRVSGWPDIVILVLGPVALVLFARGMWIGYRDPLREVSPVGRYVAGLSLLRNPPHKVMQTRLRTLPATAATLCLADIAAMLQVFGVKNDVVVDVAWAMTGAALLAWILVWAFNRPRWAVPPALREWPGWVELSRREADAELREDRRRMAATGGYPLRARAPAAKATRPDKPPGSDSRQS